MVLRCLSTVSTVVLLVILYVCGEGRWLTWSSLLNERLKFVVFEKAEGGSAQSMMNLKPWSCAGLRLRVR